MNTLTFTKDGLKWSLITNNLWGAIVRAKDYLFLEITPLNGKYKVKYRNIEIASYDKEEIKFMQKLYNIGPKADYTLAFMLGQHYDHYEWIEECNDLKELADLLENQVTFDIAFLGDVDAGGVPDIEKNKFGKHLNRDEAMENMYTAPIQEVTFNLPHNGFFTVTANFDMVSHSELEVESFLHPENAIKFAEKMKENFLNDIPEDGSLDEESSFHEHTEGFFLETNEIFHFYGVSKNGENYITISVTKTNFKDLSK